MGRKKGVVAIVDAPEICLSEDEQAGAALLNFYKNLGWDSKTEFLDPCKVRTTKNVWQKLYDIMYEQCNEHLAVGAEMVNRGPGVDDDIPEGKVYLLKGWTAPDNQHKH